MHFPLVNLGRIDPTACAITVVIAVGLSASLFMIFLLRPSQVAQGAVLDSSTISVDGTLSDWGTSSSPTTGLGVSEDGSDSSDSETANSANDLNFFWAGMSTTASSGATGATPTTPIENFYYRIDTNKTSGNLSQKYNIQLNLGLASAGKADHLLQVFANADGDSEEVELVLYEYQTPFPGIGAVTTGSLTDRVTTNHPSVVSPAPRATPPPVEPSEHTTTVARPNMASKLTYRSTGSPPRVTTMAARSKPTEPAPRRR